MIGKRPDYTKAWALKTRTRDINPKSLTLPQYFVKQGCTTAGVGKIYDPRCVDNAKDQDKASCSHPYFDIPGYLASRAAARPANDPAVNANSGSVPSPETASGRSCLHENRTTSSRRTIKRPIGNCSEGHANHVSRPAKSYYGPPADFVDSGIMESRLPRVLVQTPDLWSYPASCRSSPRYYFPSRPRCQGPSRLSIFF